jgi:hypothetical protein
MCLCVYLYTCIDSVVPTIIFLYKDIFDVFR